MAGPGDAVCIHPHLGALDGTQVRVGDGCCLAHPMQVLAGPVDRLPRVVAQGIFERLVLVHELVGVRSEVEGEKIRRIVPIPSPTCAHLKGLLS